MAVRSRHCPGVFAANLHRGNPGPHVSVGHPTPSFEDEVRDPVVGLLAVLSVRRHGQDAVLRTLSRNERAGGPISAF